MFTRSYKAAMVFIMCQQVFQKHLRLIINVLAIELCHFHKEEAKNLTFMMPNNWNEVVQVVETFGFNFSVKLLLL